MIIFNSEIDINSILFYSIIFFIITYISIRAMPKYLSPIFGECVANNKTSKFHTPMVRGIGIIFPIILVLSSIIWGSIFTKFEILIIFLSTLIGFWDDKYFLKQKKKLFFFLFLGFVWSLYQVNLKNTDINFFIELITHNFIFVFIVLFFNQIDGINGLATSTFLICILFVILTGINLILLMPLIMCVVAYFVINMGGKIGIQGDAGSFFMGSFITILLVKTIDWDKSGIIFFILGPIVFDICATTIIRACFKVDLTIGHKNNLYQKLVSRYQSHIKVTFSFAITQIVFGYFLLKLLEIESSYILYGILLLFSSLFMLLFFFTAYLIHKDKILK